MPIYFLCTISLPQGILKQIERIMRQCLWKGNTDTPRQSLAAWDLVCRPKSFGGLGVMDLSIQNDALLIKHLFKFFNKMDVLWVSLIWDTYYASAPPPNSRKAAVLFGGGMFSSCMISFASWQFH